MRLLILGGTGFVGRNLKRYFESIKWWEVDAPTRHELDLFKPIGEQWDKSYDVVIYCAGHGGRLGEKDSIETLYNNITMFDRAFEWFVEQDRTKLFVNIGSGAEQNRDRSVSNMIWPDAMPTDFYGLSKRACFEKQSGNRKCVNLRAFGLFGDHEESQRFIYRALHSYRYKIPIEIDKERRMDFFFIEDVGKIIEAMVVKRLPAQDINLSYPKRKLFLGDIANFINTLGAYKVPIHYKEHGVAKDYYGNTYPINLFLETYKQKTGEDLDLIGLEEGIKKMYGKLQR